MKTLHYLRHSIKGLKNTILQQGLDLARQVAKAIDLGIVISDDSFEPRDPRRYSRIFHGPLVRTAQTALAFCEGLGYVPKVMPAIDEIGDQKLFDAMVNDQFKTGVKEGKSNFESLLSAHHAEQIRGWASQALFGVQRMFVPILDDEIGIAFGHSPIIELAAWAAFDFRGLADGRSRLGDLEGIVFTHEIGKISVGSKISVEQTTLPTIKIIR